MGKTIGLTHQGKKYNFATGSFDIPVIDSINENPKNLGKRGEVKITFVDLPTDHTGYVPYIPGPCTAEVPAAGAGADGLARTAPMVGHNADAVLEDYAYY